MTSFTAPLVLASSLAAALTLIGPPAAAHEIIPADWCPTGQTPVILSEFALSADHLRQYRTVHAKDRYDSCLQQKTCGIIDEWFWAREAAGTHCSGLGLRSAVPQDAIPFVNAPKSFNDNRHHAAYGFNEGTLRGHCVACRPTTVGEPALHTIAP